MNVMLVSQCSKRALDETRRILDQFAERKGERTWQTAITQQGLATMRKMLRKTAKRNTAVACHWIKSANRTELLWIVGSLREFNEQGTVPTNTTGRDILRSQRENQWHTAEVIALLAAIAGLFHDFGKANQLFQDKLKGKGKTFEPYRHEWVSLRMFIAFVGELSDQEWLEKLRTIGEGDEKGLLERLFKDGGATFTNPFESLPPLARTIAWLIVSHHRLPISHNVKSAEYIDQWMNKSIAPEWNSQRWQSDEWSFETLQDNWHFPEKTPLHSKTWCRKAKEISHRALKSHSLFEHSWLEQRFTAHLARLALMLADHHYSSLPATGKWQDSAYSAYANTDPKTKQPKQLLDEHNIGVSQNAFLLATSLPKLRQTLPSITRHKDFKRRSQNDRFRWQDKSYDLACGIRDRSKDQGFFGVNMASTGCGKTFANARIMYGLADEKLGCRFSIALGLRTLTLQTGDALRDRLHLENDDLAVLIGSQAVLQLHEMREEKPEPITADNGSESAESLFAEHQYVRYDGTLDDGRLSQWLSESPTLLKMLSAPLLVSTIDHLMPATEGARGGKQIAPMLRLMTSDLVLDEPDDFDLADLPALCRLVNWTGMLGSRVLLSSATLPPSLVSALFDAYQAGRADYQNACGQPDLPPNVCCAWFDEFGVAQSDHALRDSFKTAHAEFVEKRISKLMPLPALRLADLIPVINQTGDVQGALQAMLEAFTGAMPKLHLQHHQKHANGTQVSLGLIRFANIKLLVAVAKQLMKISPPAGYQINYCVYHSQHPLAVRSYIEERLDAALMRDSSHPEKLWEISEIKAALKQGSAQNHLFVVLATSVAEVGRDHDYDWAIAEPSSMRSLIQLAGRIQRHRQQQPQSPNLLVLSKNFKALKGEELAYYRPGFESLEQKLSCHDLNDLLTPDQDRTISAIPRIQEPNGLKCKALYTNLVELEHARLLSTLFGTKSKDKVELSAKLWWHKQPTWCGQLQHLQPFRKSSPDQSYYLCLDEAGDTPRFAELDVNQPPKNGLPALKDSGDFVNQSLAIAYGVTLWLNLETEFIYQRLAEKRDMELQEVSARFGEVHLRINAENRWSYNAALGVFEELDS
jgi:CRISPR-associated endonuclease/helicase Cas3